MRAQGAQWYDARRDLGALRSAAERAYTTFGRLDILFVNAGIQSFKPILEWKDADWHDQIDVNLTGTCNAIRAVAPLLVKNGGGRIIVTSSTQGRHGTKYGADHRFDEIGGASAAGMPNRLLPSGPHLEAHNFSNEMTFVWAKVCKRSYLATNMKGTQMFAQTTVNATEIRQNKKVRDALFKLMRDLGIRKSIGNVGSTEEELRHNFPSDFEYCCIRE